MSSSQVIDSSKIERAQTIAHASKNAEFQESAVQDATSKHDAVVDAQDGSIDMTDAVAQAGRRLARGVIESRLRELNPNLFFQRSTNDPTKMGIYHPTLGFICGMEFDPSPEFTVNFILNDESGREQLVRQIRGWRTVIDRLIRKGIIEPERTKKLFQISQGRESANWSRLHS